MNWGPRSTSTFSSSPGKPRSPSTSNHPRSCAQIRAEALEVCYEKNDFCFTVHGLDAHLVNKYSEHVHMCYSKGNTSNRNSTMWMRFTEQESRARVMSLPFIHVHFGPSFRLRVTCAEANAVPAFFCSSIIQDLTQGGAMKRSLQEDG